MKSTFYTDNWVSDGSGVEHNLHKLQSGEIVQEGIRMDSTHRDHFYNTMTLKDGRKFERSCNYYIHSPYGWNEVK